MLGKKKIVVMIGISLYALSGNVLCEEESYLICSNSECENITFTQKELNDFKDKFTANGLFVNKDDWFIGDPSPSEADLSLYFNKFFEREHTCIFNAKTKKYEVNKIIAENNPHVDDGFGEAETYCAEETERVSTVAEG